MPEVEIVVPAVSEDEVSSGLRRLTRAIAASGRAEEAAGFLGGEDGCGEPDCEWCAGCECPDSAYRYYVDGVQVGGFDGWVAWFDMEVGMSHDAWRERAAAANARRTIEHDEVCRYCRGEIGNAPNFLHKATGSRVTWYKYIGRGMEVDIRDEWTDILGDCLRSLVAERSQGATGAQEDQ